MASRARGTAAWVAGLALIAPVAAWGEVVAEVPAAPAADGQETVPLPLRVTAVLDGGRSAVDRGARDGVAVGDVVWLSPREGGRYRAVVESVDGRSAVVAVLALDFTPTPGTRGEVLVPVERLGAPAGADDAEDPADSDDAGAEGEPATVDAPADTERAPSEWAYEDDGFTSAMPLLAGSGAVRPADRRAFWTGRLTLGADRTVTSDDGRGDTRLRAGADLAWENLFGYGGTVDLDVDWEDQRFDRPELDDVATSELRFERLSYRLGGTRFEPVRWQFGRFLQHGTPEFGVVDGAEWSRRLDASHTVGASVGYVPEPDAEYESGHDFQLAGWYRWVSDPTELAALHVGYQKSWHDGAADRDLVVARGHWLPRDGWTTFANVWVDLYTAGDALKGSGPEITQAFLTTTPPTGTRWGVDLQYRLLRYPELDRDEILPPVAAAQIADERIHRASADGWWRLGGDLRAVGRVGVWDDEDETGGDAEVGAELADAFGSGSRARLVGFVSEGDFTNVLGGRLDIGMQHGRLGADLFWELANYDQRGFADDNDDFLQNRVRANVSWQSGGGLLVNLYTDVATFNTERGAAAGIFAQWSF